MLMAKSPTEIRSFGGLVVLFDNHMSCNAIYELSRSASSKMC
jgi:hypothetical protein